tara:strand:+ start:64 stop:1611 length:1548 start_codon:yes stop_codon:yes gene_type:complete
MNIIVAGGGTAGWIAALLLGKNHPNHTVTVIASSSIGVLGAGEGVTGELMNLIVGEYGDLGINPGEFLRETKAMPKYGIMHKDWTNVKGQQYFGPIDGTRTSSNLPDSVFARLAAFDPDKIHLGTFFGNLYDKGISPISKVTDEVEISTYGFHMDARLTANYLEKTALKSNNISLIDAVINDVTLNDKGLVSSLHLDNGQVVSGDFFIDASGFKRIVMNKLDNKWISYQKHLPVNTAIPFFIDYKEGETPNPYTLAQAQSSGWYWEAGIQTRKGCGYVFSDEFITVDQAHREIEQTLGHSVTPLTTFKFDAGRLENTWVKNCLAIGLASSFSEPLEATSIHSTIKQLVNFSFEFLKPTIDDTLNPACITAYNKRINKMYDDFKDFVVSHYLGGRNDSEFWKYISSGAIETDFAAELRDMCKTKMPTSLDFPNYPGAAGWGIWSYVLFGTGQLTSEVAQKHLTPQLINNANYQLSKMTNFANTAKLTHYTLEEYFSIIKQRNHNFNPERGVEWHLE